MKTVEVNAVMYYAMWFAIGLPVVADVLKYLEVCA